MAYLYCILDKLHSSSPKRYLSSFYLVHLPFTMSYLLWQIRAGYQLCQKELWAHIAITCIPTERAWPYHAWRKARKCSLLCSNRKQKEIYLLVNVSSPLLCHPMSHSLEIPFNITSKWIKQTNVDDVQTNKIIFSLIQIKWCFHSIKMCKSRRISRAKFGIIHFNKYGQYGFSCKLSG